MASSSGRQPNFAALNRRRHLCSAGRPSGWALAHILVLAFKCYELRIRKRYDSLRTENSHTIYMITDLHKRSCHDVLFMSLYSLYILSCLHALLPHATNCGRFCFWRRQSVVIFFVYEISREPLNGSAQNSHGRRFWSIARTSLKVKVKGQMSR